MNIDSQYGKLLLAVGLLRHLTRILVRPVKLKQNKTYLYVFGLPHGPASSSLQVFLLASIIEDLK